MDKEQLVKLLESLDLPKGEYYVLSSGILVLYGLREKAGDLDLCVSEELFEILKERYALTEADKNLCGFYKVSDLVEVVVNKKADMEYDFCEGWPVQKLQTLLKFKKGRMAEKDIKDIAKIEEYLKNNGISEN